MKLLVTVGTRPEAVKMAPIIMATRSHADIQVTVCATAQHREMLDQVLDLFAITPEYDLNVMRRDQHLTDVTASVLLGVRDVLRRERPDFILVQGDTVTTFAAALAGFYERVRVAHIEAGLRTYDLDCPFPEEAMRQMTTRLATLHFAPTERNRATLIAEGIPNESVFVTGNPVIDALYWTVERVKKTPPSLFAAQWGRAAEAITSGRRLILVTAHRRENFGPALRNICEALLRLANDNPDVEIVYPVHPNPNLVGPVQRLLGDTANIHLLDPLDYVSFVYLMSRSYFLISDSGGVQEEAPALGKPVLVTRTATERGEGIANGVVRLVGTDRETIVEEAQRLLDSPAYYAQFVGHNSPYGSGDAAAQIVRILADHCGRRQLSTAAATAGTNAPPQLQTVIGDLAIRG